jgi:SAM-dependent methyltransferase
MITGERVSVPEGGFNPTFQRHVAAYRLCAPLLGDGRVLDLGCGVGHSFAELEPRESVGVDVDAGALASQERETVVADMRRLPFSEGSFSSVISVHSIEHVPDPERALSEVVRVLASGGRAVLVTPNRLTFGPPEEIIDPYHYVEYDAAELSALCSRLFTRVEVLGLYGSARYQRLVDAERRELDRLLRLDPLRLRRLVPRALRQRLYDRRLAASRAMPAPGALEIVPEDFTLQPGPLAAALDLVAVCNRGS